MSKKICSVENCDRGAATRGMCGMHSARADKGRPLDAKPILRGVPIEDHYEIDAESGCWNWAGYLTTEGYGLKGGSNAVRAHRWIYELQVGPIPDGLVIDHLCRNRGCVNPEHLEPVTPAENTRRGMSPGIVARREKRCMKGLHDFTPENTYVDPQGRSTCRACVAAYRKRRPPETPEQYARHLERNRAWRARRSAEAS